MADLTARLLGENFEEALKELHDPKSPYAIPFFFQCSAQTLAVVTRELHARLRMAKAEGAAETFEDIAFNVLAQGSFGSRYCAAKAKEIRAAIRKGIEGQPPALGITDGEILDWLQIKGIATQEDGGTFAAKNMGVHSWRDEGAGVLRWTARWINSECKSLREAARIAITAERGGR